MNSSVPFIKYFYWWWIIYAIIQNFFLGEGCSGYFCLFCKFLAFISGVFLFYSCTVCARSLLSDEKAHWKWIYYFLSILFQMSLLLWVVLSLFTRGISVLYWVLSLVCGNFCFPTFRFWICMMLFSPLGCFLKANKLTLNRMLYCLKI